MKKTALILALAFCTIASNAQSLIPTKFGLKVGMNYANLNITPIEGVKPTDNSAQIGIAAGVCVHIALSDKWFINPEVLYSQKGASFNYRFTDDYPINQRDEYATTNKIVLSYVELNPTISYKASDKIALNFGPSVSFLIGDEYTYTQDPKTATVATHGLTGGLLVAESLDIGFNMGISYFLTEQFFIDTRVYTGFMEVAKATQSYEEIPLTADPTPEYLLKNRAIVLSLAYLF